jgi:hypothetical protein
MESGRWHCVSESDLLLICAYLLLVWKFYICNLRTVHTSVFRSMPSIMFLVCNHCGKKFNKDWHLKQHMKYHDQANVSCDKCRKSFQNLAIFNIHLHHCGTINCEVCQETLSKKSLNRHMQTKHKGSEDVKCSHCTYTTARKDSMNRHIKNTHEQRDLLKCPQCEFTCTGSDILNNHKRKHNGILSCKLCGKTFSRTDNLSTHVKKCEMKRKKLCCESCAKTFTKSTNLTRHIENVHNTITSDLGVFKLDMNCTIKKTLLNSICDVCGKDFKFPNKLKRHMQIHTNMKSTNKSNNKVQKSYGDLHKSQKNVIIKNTADQISSNIGSLISKGNASPSFRTKVMSRIKGSYDELNERQTSEITEEKVFTLSEELGLSDRKIIRKLSIMKELGVKVPKYVGHKLKDKKTFANDLMTREDVTIVNKNGKIVKQNLVHTTDIQAYIERLADKRDINLSDPENEVIIEMDDGKKSLKIIVNIINKSNIKEVRKDSGPYRSHIVACIFTCPESHGNLLTILDKINYFNLKIKHNIICDLKLANILCGISSSSGRHPCFIGECHKLVDGTWRKANFRTIDSLNQDNCKWKLETNSNKAKVKNYNNSENVPLLNTHMSSRVIKDILLIPTLHTIVLGPVNKLMKHIGNYISLDDLDNKLTIHRDEYHGMTYQGRACRKIMNNVDTISDMLGTVDSELKLITNTLRELKKVDTLCNSTLLDPNYRNIIEGFTESWKQIHKIYKISIPNKVHIIMDHLHEHFDSTGQTFHKKSDQTIESVHQLFQKILMKGYYCKNIDSDVFTDKLYHAVLHFNGYHC